MKISRNQLAQIILKEAQAIIDEEEGPGGGGKGCAETEEKCIRQSSDGTWYILNNQKGGKWREGFGTKKEAQEALRGFHFTAS